MSGITILVDLNRGRTGLRYSELEATDRYAGDHSVITLGAANVPLPVPKH
jgi:hypothetical protein